MELLAPAGNFEKLKTAFYFGADAVYLAGKQFGLRAFAGNFDEEELVKAVKYAHNLNKKVYVTLNIIARDKDFVDMKNYVLFLEKAKVDGVIVADLGVTAFVREIAPNLPVHVSTQANIINSYSANLMAKMGVKRIVLARELSLEEIINIRKNLPSEVELETFVHGAMCISYSGRCLLSNYLTGRDSNRGECVQACRWEYTIKEKSRDTQSLEIQEDDKGTYILNSKDLNMLENIKDLIDAGVVSFKIEGRMKSPYYVATVVNAYRRVIDKIKVNKDYKVEKELIDELEKTSHRNYTTGFYYNATNKENLQTSMPVQTHEFTALVLEDTDGEYTLIEQRNRFKIGDNLEVLSPNENFNQKITITEIKNMNNESIEDAKNVQEKLYIKTNIKLYANDILRKKI